MVKPPSINEVVKVISKLESELKKIEPQIKWLKSAMDKELSGLTAQVHTLTTALQATTQGLENVQSQLDGVASKPAPSKPVPPPVKPPTKPDEVVPPTVLEVEDEDVVADIKAVCKEAITCSCNVEYREYLRPARMSERATKVEKDIGTLGGKGQKED